MMMNTYIFIYQLYDLFNKASSWLLSKIIMTGEGLFQEYKNGLRHDY